MDPVRTLAAYLLLAIAAGGSAQQAPEAAVYMPAYTVAPAQREADAQGAEKDGAVTEATAPEAQQTEKAPEATATPMPGGIERILYRRLTGEDVATVQRKLIDLGYLKGKADGVFGRETYNAVIQFQIAHDLEPDGIVGENTLTWLYSGEAIALPTATPETTAEPTPTRGPTPMPTATPAPTAATPDAWRIHGEGPCPVSEQRTRAISVSGQVLEGLFAYTDEAGEVYLPLRALVHALDYPEYVHEDGGAYEFTVSETQKEIAIGCAANAQGVVTQAMVMTDGYLFVPETPYSLLRWDDELFIPVRMWNDVVKNPAVEVAEAP
jgi:peptidoglycan hydrolase-like protein with peptidoglycan-binding domain